MYKMYDYNDDYQYQLIPLLIALALIFIVWIGTSISDDNAWNNGYCSCGGKWQYEQAVGHRYYDTNYIYRCDKCDKIHEFEEYR